MDTNPVMDICAADKVSSEIHLWLSYDFGRYVGGYRRQGLLFG
jgi:hypothetical protein